MRSPALQLVSIFFDFIDPREIVIIPHMLDTRAPENVQEAVAITLNDNTDGMPATKMVFPHDEITRFDIGPRRHSEILAANA